RLRRWSYPYRSRASNLLRGGRFRIRFPPDLSADLRCRFHLGTKTRRTLAGPAHACSRPLGLCLCRSAERHERASHVTQPISALPRKRTSDLRAEYMLFPPPTLRERRHRRLARRLAAVRLVFGPRGGRKRASTSMTCLPAQRPPS